MPGWAKSLNSWKDRRVENAAVEDRQAAGDIGLIRRAAGAGIDISRCLATLITDTFSQDKVVAVCSGPGRHHFDDGAVDPIIHIKGVHLNGRFLDCVRVGNQVQNAGRDIAGDVQTIDHIHISNAAAVVRACRHLGFGGVIVVGLIISTYSPTPKPVTR